jgi:hypothetical protein
MVAGEPARMDKIYLTSQAWVAWFNENAKTAALRHLPEAEPDQEADVRAAIAASLPAWQLGETSEGRNLRLAAAQYAQAHGDPQFLQAVELFIREEQRHGHALGQWLDLAGIARKKSDLGDSLFRFCRYAIPNYAVWASIVVMVESMAEIYYASVRRLTKCPLLQAECERILRDEVRHIQFQCEHLAYARQSLTPVLRIGLRISEAAFYAVVCSAVWLAHGRLMRLSGISTRKFVRLAGAKFRFMQNLMDPRRYASKTARLPIPLILSNQR